MIRNLLAVMLLGTLMTGVSEAVETKLVVRAVARDAKFIGSSMGGARVTIRDSAGAVLAEGRTEGGTGNTRGIMADPRKRGARLSDEATARFEAKIDIDEPRLVTIEVEARSGPGPSVIKSTAQVWMIPGKDITGDGFMMEIPGFYMEVQSPRLPEAVPRSDGKAVVPVMVRVAMMCGCPIEPGGMWNADQYEVSAIVRLNGNVEQTLPLSYSGPTGTFGGRLELEKAGSYELTVYAFDPLTGNAGVDKTTVRVR